MRTSIGLSLILALAVLGGCTRSVHYSSGVGGASLGGYGPHTHSAVCHTTPVHPAYRATTVHTTTWTYGSYGGYRSPYGIYHRRPLHNGYRSPFGTYRKSPLHGGYRSPYGTYHRPHRRTPHCPY